MSNSNLRFPRSMGEINPYMSGPVESMPEPYHPRDVIVMVASAVTAVVVAVMALATLLPGGGV